MGKTWLQRMLNGEPNQPGDPCSCAFDQVPLRGPHPQCTDCHGTGEYPPPTWQEMVNLRSAEAIVRDLAASPPEDRAAIHACAIKLVEEWLAPVEQSTADDAGSKGG